MPAPLGLAYRQGSSVVVGPRQALNLGEAQPDIPGDRDRRSRGKVQRREHPLQFVDRIERRFRSRKSTRRNPGLEVN
jgi:hypothetical protein